MSLRQRAKRNHFSVPDHMSMNDENEFDDLDEFEDEEEIERKKVRAEKSEPQDAFTDVCAYRRASRLSLLFYSLAAIYYSRIQHHQQSISAKRMNCASNQA
jgi:hypothetical protein